jgi:hypothetical protein
MELKKKYTPLIIEKNKKVTKIFNYRSFKSNYKLEKAKTQNLGLAQIMSHFNGSLSSTNHSKH